MKILDYLIRFKNESKPGADAAKKEIESIGQKTEEQAGRAQTATKALGEAMRDGTRRILSMIPGGGIFSKLVGAVPSAAIGAVSIGLLGVRKLVNAAADGFAQFSARIDESSASYARFAASMNEKLRFTISAEDSRGNVKEIEANLIDLQKQQADIYRRANSKNPAMLMDVQFAEKEIGPIDEKVRLAERQLELAKERVRVNIEGEAASARVAETSAARKARMEIVEARKLKEVLESGDYNRLVKLRDESGAAMVDILAKGPGYGGGDATKEENELLAKLSAAFDSASVAIESFDDKAKQAADAMAETRNQHWKEFQELRGKLREERIENMPPEKQLQIRRADYAAVVNEGRKLSIDDPRKVELANEAMRLREIMRPLIASQVATASDNQAGSESEPMGRVRRVRRGPLGLGRLSGNRAGYRFGRVLSSQFDGAGVGGSGSAPGKRPMEDIGEEQLRVLKSIEAKTGFGKGG